VKAVITAGGLGAHLGRIRSAAKAHARFQTQHDSTAQNGDALVHGHHNLAICFGGKVEIIEEYLSSQLAHIANVTLGTSDNLKDAYEGTVKSWK
jgi:hypothetical protein